MRLIDELYTQYPCYGRRRMKVELRKMGLNVSEKRISRLMTLMGIEAVYPKANLSQRHPGHKIYPYLLRGVEITHPGQVWSTDITYVRMANGFAYLTAVIDWFSRYVLSWRLSNTLDSGFCIEALQEALTYGCPEVFNTDQGSQFTSERFTTTLENAGIKISMDGRGRALDNVFVERLWRTVKYEHIYLHDYSYMPELNRGLANYFGYYNRQRPHQALAYCCPQEVYNREA